MAIYQIPGAAFDADAGTSTAPLIVLFERDDAIAIPLLSQLRLASYDVRAARTPVELFDILSKHLTALVLVDLGSATAGRREFWIALDAHRRGRPTQVMTFRQVSKDDLFDMDFEPSARALADVDVQGVHEFQLIIEGVRQRVPLNGAPLGLPSPQGFGVVPGTIMPIGALLGVPSPFMQGMGSAGPAWGGNPYGEHALGAPAADPYAAHNQPFGAPSPFQLGASVPDYPAGGLSFPGAQPGQYTPAPANPYGSPSQGGLMGSEPASPFANPVQANPFAQPVEQSPFALPLNANPFAEMQENSGTFGASAANPFAAADLETGRQSVPFGQPGNAQWEARPDAGFGGAAPEPWSQSPGLGFGGAGPQPFGGMSPAPAQGFGGNGFYGNGQGMSYPAPSGAFGTDAAPPEYLNGFGGAGSQPGQRSRPPAEISDVWTPPDGGMDGPTGVVPEMAYKRIEPPNDRAQAGWSEPTPSFERQRDEDAFARIDAYTHDETAPVPAPSRLPAIRYDNPAERALGNVLVEGALLSENKLEALKGIQQMLATVDMEFKLGELALLFKFLSPDQLLAALLVSRGLVSPQQIAGLGRVKQELAASGMDYDLEALLGMFHILPADQLNQLRAELA